MTSSNSPQFDDIVANNPELQQNMTHIVAHDNLHKMDSLAHTCLHDALNADDKHGDGSAQESGAWYDYATAAANFNQQYKNLHGRSHQGKEPCPTCNERFEHKQCSLGNCPDNP